MYFDETKVGIFINNIRIVSFLRFETETNNVNKIIFLFNKFKSKRNGNGNIKTN